MPSRISGLVASLAAAFVPPAAADEIGDLLAGINGYRKTRDACGGRTLAPAPSMQREPALEPALRLAAQGVPLETSLQRAGYAAARAEMIHVTGPRDAATVLRFIVERHCSALKQSEYRVFSAYRAGDEWRLMLAEPRVPAELADWPAAGAAILELVNQARAEPRNCGGKRFNPAPHLRWSDALARAALAHSEAMAKLDFFGHSGTDGSDVAVRARRAGYRFSAIGENIAAGPGSARATVAGWLKSPGHCANIMQPHFSEMGAAYAVNPRAAMAIYWTQVLGAP